MFIIFLLFLISFVVSQDFMAFGVNTNITIVFPYHNNCNFNTCQKAICDILINKIFAYVILYPLEKITYCPKFPPNFNVNMITFIFKENEQMVLPVTCDTMGDCIEKGCNNYLSDKESLFIAFTGQCL
jgi:hypothetical protein